LSKSRGALLLPKPEPQMLLQAQLAREGDQVVL
jgi:hypothetical protein